MIVLEDVRKVYEPNVTALDGVSFVIDKGEFVFVVGASGSGQVDDHPPAPEGARADVGAHPRRRPRPRPAQALEGADAAPERRLRLPGLQAACRIARAAENVAYALRVQGEPAASIRRKVPEVLNLVGLAHKMSSKPEELSGGEQQRVSIARAVVNHPPLLICDEPTGNLDPDTSVGIMQLLHRINTAGTTILMVTHDREMVDKMRKRVIALDHGKLMRDERRGGYETE